MRIDILQVANEGKNEFDILYDNQKIYRAILPFISIEDPFNAEKLRSMKILDTYNNIIYSTDYQYVTNLKEEFIPLKYLITGSQKFNQLLFHSAQNTIKIYFEQNDIWKNRYVIEISDKQYFCYSVEDGYIRHFPVYDGDVQVGEALKSNVVVDGKDEYCCYLMNGYEFLTDGITALLLYLDRNEYSSSYLVKKSYTLQKRYSYNKNNALYDKNWVSNNFGDEYYQKVDQDVKIFKEKMKHPVQTFKEQWADMTPKEQKTMKFVLLAPWVGIAIVLLFVLFIFIVILLQS